MRRLKMITLLTMVLGIATLVNAKLNKYGVSDMQTITFASAIRVGDVLLPQGEYEVRHTMEAQNHIMVFRQLHKTKPVQASVKCTLVPLKAKAQATQVVFDSNAAKENVLRRLVFRGDMAEHVF